MLVHLLHGIGLIWLRLDEVGGLIVIGILTGVDWLSVEMDWLHYNCIVVAIGIVVALSLHHVTLLSISISVPESIGYLLPEAEHDHQPHQNPQDHG